MIGLVAKLPVKEGKVDEAVGLVKKLMVDVGKEEGTLLYTLNVDKANPNTLVIMERYKDKAALDFHSSTPYFKEFFGRIGPLMAGKPEISAMNEIASI